MIDPHWVLENHFEAAKKIELLQDALEYTLEVAEGWYDDLNGRKLIDDDERIRAAKNLLNT